LACNAPLKVPVVPVMAGAVTPAVPSIVTDIDQPSHMMLMVPPVSVTPVSVVMRRLSKTPARVTLPKVDVTDAPPYDPFPFDIQRFPVGFTSVTTKDREVAAVWICRNPVVSVADPVPAEIATAADEYPVTATEPPEPILTTGDIADPEVRLLTITVTRFAHDGITDRKSTDTADAVCTAPRVRAVPWAVRVLVVSGSVRVWLVLVAGEAMMNVAVPEAFGARVILLITRWSKLSQRGWSR
jgi:hypothetical protein